MKNFRRLLGYAKKYRFQILLALVCALVSSLGVVAATYLNGVAIDHIHGPGAVDFPGLIQILIGLGVIYVISSLFQWFISRYANKVSYLVVRDMRRDTFHNLNLQPLSYYDNHPHGDIISRFTNDLDSVSDAMAVSITNAFSGIVTLISAVAFMFYLNVTITVTILVLTPICLIVAYFITKFSQKTFTRQQQSVGELSSFAAEIVGNQKIVKAFGREGLECEEFDNISDRLRKTATHAMFASAMVNPSTRFVNNICYIAVGIAGGIIAVTQGVSVGIISSFLIYSAQFAKPFNEISGITAQLQTAFASLERIFAVIDAPPQTSDIPDAMELHDCKGHVCFDHVSFSYRSDQKLIQDFCFEAKPGQTIAIVGPTGCGKTTLVNLLMRFYEVTDGAILIDGIDTRRITRDSLRQSFGMVLQDTWLMGGSIRENLTYGKPDATQEEIEQAAKAAHAHGFITRLKDGYDTVVSQEGGQLSQGQRQLLTIARAMLADPEMLILDEATSSIDTLTEIRIQKAFLKLMEGRTSFVIAHRLSTIVNADQILVMNQGNIVEQGTHTQLLEKKGFYYELYNSQYANS
ncbi:ABC transporter ATP-binding protein [Massilioclostridium coli]|uniref:ABC transporter ATP-binding protein n=1 Tax=Massilioclostridium coli TaxID=1870991 RepID=UPI00085C25D5|nr:ABC transporter ATP-binding protein [Massilioclostridium coli]